MARGVKSIPVAVDGLGSASQLPASQFQIRAHAERAVVEHHAAGTTALLDDQPKIFF